MKKVKNLLVSIALMGTVLGLASCGTTPTSSAAAASSAAASSTVVSSAAVSSVASSSEVALTDVQKKVKEAELHAEEDRKKKDRMEALNQAESTIYQTEKTLEEVGDKASQEEKDAVNSAVSDLKAVIANENASGDEIRKAIDEVMNKKSGMLGLFGTSDNRTIESEAKAGNPRAKLVESMLCHQLTKYIGGFAAAMGGLDAIVFTGGIGENNPQYRDRVCDKLAFMGAKINYELNDVLKHGKEGEISTPDSKIRIFVICTNEELMIARDTKEIVEAL